MEKRAVIKPGLTPDVTPKATKEANASRGKETRRLDDDLTKRAAETARKRLR